MAPDLFARFARDAAATQAGAVEEALTTFRAERGRWPGFVWCETSYEGMKVVFTARAGDTPPAPSIFVSVWDARVLQRREISE